MGRDTMGVKGMTVKEDDHVLGWRWHRRLPSARPSSSWSRARLRQAHRSLGLPRAAPGSQGVKTIQVTPKKGPITGMKMVLPQHELMLISEEGVVIRVSAKDISKLGRSTQGVKVMNVAETDRVSAIARVSAGKKRVKAAGGPGDTHRRRHDRAGLPDRRAGARSEELASEDFEDVEEDDSESSSSAS